MWPYNPIALTSLHLCRERCTDVHQQANLIRKASRQVRMSRLFTTFLEIHKFCNGSEADISTLSDATSASERKAELPEVRKSGELCSRFSHERNKLQLSTGLFCHLAKQEKTSKPHSQYRSEMRRSNHRQDLSCVCFDQSPLRTGNGTGPVLKQGHQLGVPDTREAKVFVSPIIRTQAH